MTGYASDAAVSTSGSNGNGSMVPVNSGAILNALKTLGVKRLSLVIKRVEKKRGIVLKKLMKQKSALKVQSLAA